MKTKITELLHIDFPIIQAGLPYMAGWELAVSVTEAGGLGVIGSAGMSPEQLSKEINFIKDATWKTFAVHIDLSEEGAEERAQVLAMERPPVIICSGGNPAGYMPVWKENAAIVIPVVNSVTMVDMMVKANVDAIIAEGSESGWRTGYESVMSLVPSVVDSCKIPVIAAGGIQDGRAIAAAIMLGAGAVQIGTRFAASTQSLAHENYKKKLVAAKNTDSELLGYSTGHPVRALKNAFTREYFKKEKAGATAEELDQMISEGFLKAIKEGDVNHGVLAAGQVTTPVREIRDAAEIVHELIEETEWVLLNGSHHG